MDDSDDAHGGESGRGEDGEEGDESSLSEEGENLERRIDSREWQARLEAFDVPRSYLNKLVMSYIIVQGYQDAAAHFQRESGTEPSVDLRTIEERVAIRRAVLEGDIPRAVDLVNRMDPEMLQQDRTLLFQLKRQHLLELIRARKTDDALDFARDELASLGEADPTFLEQLEQTMTLLAFKDARTSPLAHLLDVEQRQATAGRLNASILAAQYEQKEPRLPDLLRLLEHAQRDLDGRTAYPVVTGLAVEDDD
ncbi:unnamed protein product [Phaeothamnion confervicola]